MGDGCSPHIARAKARKIGLTLTRVMNFQTIKRKKGFMSLSVRGAHEFVSFLCLFSFFPLSGKERKSVREEKLEFLK